MNITVSKEEVRTRLKKVGDEILELDYMCRWRAVIPASFLLEVAVISRYSLLSHTLVLAVDVPGVKICSYRLPCYTSDLKMPTWLEKLILVRMWHAMAFKRE